MVRFSKLLARMKVTDIDDMKPEDLLRIPNASEYYQGMYGAFEIECLKEIGATYASDSNDENDSETGGGTTIIGAANSTITDAAKPTDATPT